MSNINPKVNVVRTRHRWADPNNKISTFCLRCGCRRFAERFSSGMGWIYIQEGKINELTKIPSCISS